ncbi:MAG: hypothetical protein HQL66_15365 [Magnetococcales bacterium]|nr:hypothetical protein [Magnetococcales bacterium]
MFSPEHPPHPLLPRFFPPAPYTSSADDPTHPEAPRDWHTADPWRDFFLPSPATLRLVTAITGLDREAIADLYPSEFRQLLQASLAVNGAGFRLAALHLSAGGLLPGQGNHDAIPALLTPGEFVISKGAVADYGVAMLDAINQRTLSPVDPPGGHHDSLASSSPHARARQLVDALSRLRSAV